MNRSSIPIDMVTTNVVIYRYERDDFIFVDVNKEVEKTEQLQKADLIGKRLTEVFPGVKEFGLFDVLLRVNETGKTEVFETAFYEDERIRGWRQNTICKLPEGTVAALYEDKTRTKQLESDLLSLGMIVDNSMNEIYIFDADDLHFTYVNSGAQQNTGYSLEEMRQMTPPDINPHLASEAFRAMICPLVEGEEALKIFETVHRRKDGSDYNVEVRLQLIDGDESNRIVVFANDITERTAIECRLKQSEEKFRKIAESSQVGILIYKEHIVYANRACMNMSGYSLDELYKMPIWEFADASIRDQIKKMTERRLQGENFPQEYNDFKFRTKEGVEKIIRAMTQTIRYEEGYAGLATIMDITDLTETKKQLNLLAQAVEQTDDLIKITDREGNLIYVNDSLVAHSGYKKSELIGKNPRIFKSGEHDEAFFENLWETILSGKTFRDTFINRRKDRSIVYEEETITPIQDSKGRITHFVATGKNVTEQILMEQELTKRATIDMLTDIYNRDEANRQIEIALNDVKRYGSRFGLVMLDIDHFKEVNDEYGHDVGDDVLKTFSKIVSMHIRKSDIFARWGGEEFIIITPHLEDGALMKFAEKLRIVVGACEFSQVGTMSVSIGVTEFGSKDTKKGLLKRVDEALYMSKAKGRDCITYLEVSGAKR